MKGWRHFNFAALPVSPWRNGGGETHEIFSWPAGKGAKKTSSWPHSKTIAFCCEHRSRTESAAMLRQNGADDAPN